LECKREAKNILETWKGEEEAKRNGTNNEEFFSLG